MLRVRSLVRPAAIVAAIGAAFTAGIVVGRDRMPSEHEALVPSGVVIDGAWPVRAGGARSQLAVAWHRPGARSWNLTLGAHSLISDSPYPIRDWWGHPGVRVADVTDDGYSDVLVSLGIPHSNHGATLISVFSGAAPYRRIYGAGVGPEGARGRTITESEWGARDGMLWFIEPRGGQSVCCPDHRVVYELRWNGRDWDRVYTRRIPARYS